MSAYEINCPCCGFIAEAASQPGLQEELRSHVLWTHLRSNDWGEAPTPFAAIGLFLHLGLLSQEEAQQAGQRAFQETVPRPSWLRSSTPFFAVWLCWLAMGVFYGYQWGRFGHWWSPLGGLIAFTVVLLLDLFRHRRRWQGHPTRKQLERVEVPDTLPQEWADRQAEE